MSGLFKDSIADPNKIKLDLHPKPLTDEGQPFSLYTPTPDRKLVVSDPETNKVIGEIWIPTDFCPGLGCPYGGNPFSYYNMYTEHGNRRWAHVYCDRPTRKWWIATFKDLINLLVDDTNL